MILTLKALRKRDSVQNAQDASSSHLIRSRDQIKSLCQLYKETLLEQKVHKRARKLVNNYLQQESKASKEMDILEQLSSFLQDDENNSLSLEIG